MDQINSEENGINFPLYVSWLPNENIVRILTDFCESYLQDKPDDIIIYALDYFQKLKHPKTPESTTDLNLSYEQVNIDHELDLPRNTANVTVNVPEDFLQVSNVLALQSDKTNETKAFLLEYANQSVFFETLHHDQLRLMLFAMYKRVLKPGEYLVRFNDVMNIFFIVEEGRINVYEKKPQNVLVVCLQTDIYGEKALVHDYKGEVEIQSTCISTIWILSGESYRHILKLKSIPQMRFNKTHLEYVPMLRNLTEKEINMLARVLVSKVYLKDMYVYKQGDVADGLYFIQHGSVRLSIKGNKKSETEINRLGVGNMFGEFSLITYQRRPLSVQALEHLRVQLLPVETLEAVAGCCINIMKREKKFQQQMLKVFGSRSNMNMLRITSKEKMPPSGT